MIHIIRSHIQPQTRISQISCLSLNSVSVHKLIFDEENVLRKLKITKFKQIRLGNLKKRK